MCGYLTQAEALVCERTVGTQPSGGGGQSLTASLQFSGGAKAEALTSGQSLGEGQSPEMRLTLAALTLEPGLSPLQVPRLPRPPATPLAENSESDHGSPVERSARSSLPFL